MLSSLTADDAFQIAMKFCSYRERSEKEVRDKLKKKKL